MKERRCAHDVKLFEKCTARVEQYPERGEACDEELFDLLHCVDHCVSEQIFSKLK